jgi:hypothetical protein
MLYPLSYEGKEGQGSAPVPPRPNRVASSASLCLCCRAGYVGISNEPRSRSCSPRTLTLGLGPIVHHVTLEQERDALRSLRRRDERVYSFA